MISKNQFQKIKVIEDLTKTDKLKEKEFFMHGSSMIAQKMNKIPGQQVSYFKVTKKTNNSIEYTTIFDILN